MALVLLLESSTEVCSVALSLDGKLIDLKETTEGMNHSRLLTVYAEEILSKHKLKVTKLDAVAVSKGPGSYTGLRIGVSAAKGICYASQLPLMGIGTLDAMASYVAKNPKEFDISLEPSTLLCPMIDARRMEVYSAIYDAKGKMVQPISTNIIEEKSFSELLATTKIIFLGNGAAKCKEVITHENAHFAEPEKASARFMVGLAEELYNKKAFENVAYFEPFYLKDFVATVPKNKMW